MTKKVKPTRRDRRAVRDGPRTMLMIRVKYLGSGGDPASYCNEQCMRDNAWNGISGHLDGMIRESSYGKVSFPQSSGRVTSVQVSKYISSQQGCPVEQMKNDADAQLRNQGVNLNSYDHRVYYIPANTPGCGWAGLAYVGGSISWMKHRNPTLFAHEIGHNLGLHHASLDRNNDGQSESEYGDHSAIMGNDLAWRGFLGANRYSLGWVPTSNVFQWDRVCTASSIGQIRIHALNRSPGHGGAYALMRFTRNSGGNYFVTLRANEGYDKTMKTQWRDQVQVKYMVGTRTYHVSALPAGQTFTDGSTQITALSISNGIATVRICNNGNTGNNNHQQPAAAVQYRG